MDKTTILGVSVSVLGPRELDRAIRRLLFRRRAHLVTPNPEFLLLAQDDQEFFSVLNKADISVPDGIGLKFAAWLKRVNLKRFSGANLVNYLLELSDHKHLRVAVANWKRGLSSDSEILEAIKRRYPKLKTFVFSMEREDMNYDVKRLRAFRPDIVFSTLGAPYQDIFIRKRLLREIPSIRLAMGVGGSFDFLTGRIKRAPRVFQRLGFEWLWRLGQQPHRWKRIWNAVVVFPLTVVLWQFRRFFYRPNVVIMIVNQYKEVLILNRNGRNNYWGLPQGGIDAGESVEEAAWREMKEETGVTEATIIGRFDNICSYIWPKHYTNHGYKGQRQTLFIFSAKGTPRITMDRTEHKGYKWVKLADFVQSVSPVHRQNYELFLKKYYAITR